MSLTITKDRLPELLKIMEAITKKQVLIGIPDDSDRTDGSLETNAQIAYVHEFGSPAANVPPRPFLIPGVQAVQDKVATQLGKGAGAALDGNANAASQSLIAAGLTAQNSVKNEITQGSFAPLAASTLAARKARGFAGERPLVETGSMRNAITFVVEEK
jgi:hypothetical protein